MPAYNYRVGCTYAHTALGKQFTVTSIDEHEFDPDLTEVELVWEDGEWQSIYADEFSNDVRKVSDPATLDDDKECECDFSAFGWHGGDYYCLACGGK